MTTDAQITMEINRRTKSKRIKPDCHANMMNYKTKSGGYSNVESSWTV